jgi:hypothetical protein
MKKNQYSISRPYSTRCNYLVILNMISNFLSLLTVLLLIQVPLAAAEANLPPADLTTFDHFDESNGTLVFAAPSGTTPPKPLKLDLSEVKHLGTLHPPEGAPYFLVSGKPCKTCQDQQAIFAIRPNERKPTAFVFPGKILDPKSRGLLLESRAFFGKCLPSHGDIYIVYQQERVDRRNRLQASVLIGEAAKDHLNETLVDRHAPQLQTTLKMVKRKQCQEIEGRNRLMLSRPLDLHPHNALPDDDTDNNEASKNQKTSAPKNTQV